MPMSPAEPPPPAPRPLRRLTLELCLLVLAKVALLALIWWLAFAPHPRPDASPAAIGQLLGPTSTPAQEALP